MKRNHLLLAIGLLLCSLTALAPQAALALTPACTPIGNKADVAYKVGGFDQAVVSSATNTIVVGNKVDLTVTAGNASPGVAVVSGQTDKYLTFTITNSGNANQRYALSVGNGGGVYSGSTTTVFSDNQTVNSTIAATSPQTGDATGNALTMTAVVSAGSSTTVTIKATMPSGLSNDTYAVYSLVAQAYKVNGTTAEADGSSPIDSAYGTCSADVLVGDGAGTDDSAKDGKSSARNAFHAVLTTLTVSKTSTVYSDPVNGVSGSAKSIPGAVMEYIVAITNPAGGQDATAVTITDTLDALLTPLSGANWTSRTGSYGPACSGQAQVNINGGGWQCLTGGIGSSSWAGQKLTGTINTLSTGQTATILYQATIN